jgi:hypothetical protein
MPNFLLTSHEITSLMALAILTDIENVSADVTTADLVDLTTYGGANADRNDLALYLYLYKRSADLTDTQITITNNDPLNVVQWNFSLNGDGWYRAIVFAFPIWVAGSYVLNNCVYYNGGYWMANTSTTGTPGVSANWTAITDILADVLNLSNSNVTIGQTNNFTTASAEVNIIGNDLQDLGPKIRMGKCKDINDAARVLLGEGLIDSAWMNFERGDVVEAQQIVDYVNSQWAA